jgi:hypothetical protein
VVKAVTGSAVVNAPKFSHTFFNKIIFAILWVFSHALQNYQNTLVRNLSSGFYV